MPYHIIQPSFPPGNLLVTDAILSRGFDYQPYLKRHLSTDWGDISDYERACNDQSLLNDLEVLSQYVAYDSAQESDLITICTAADRSYTVIFLAGEN